MVFELLFVFLLKFYRYGLHGGFKFTRVLTLFPSMGISMSKPPLIREPLRDTIEVGGYVIRSLGGVIAQATVSTSDHNSFRLEVPCASLSTNFDAITVDEKYNIMTIAIPSDQKGSPFMKLVQISVPKYKKVRNLEIGNPLDNGGKIIVTGR